MNRLEKLKNSLAEKHYKESGHVPTEWAVMNFNSGFDAASAEYEKIIAELEGALKKAKQEMAMTVWRDEEVYFQIEEALQKLKEFRGVG